MANPEHEAILRQGVEVWNKWRKDNHEIVPDLSGLSLGKSLYPEVNLSHANLYRVSFAGTLLINADFSFANLEQATLFSLSLQDINFSHANFNLSRLTNLNFSGANLRGAQFRRTFFHEINFSGADLTDSICSTTIFINVNFLKTIGLERVQHKGKSSISVDSLVISKGDIPAIFLRGCGVPEKLIAALPSLME